VTRPASQPSTDGARPDKWRTERTREQRSAEEDLRDYPHRLEVRGTPDSLRWPEICANCAAPASERIRLRKAFYRYARRRSVGWFGYKVVSARVPFCGACASRHRETVPRVPWLRRYGWFVFNPAHIATIGLVAVLTMVLPSAREMSLTSNGATVAWGLVGFCLFGIAWTIGVTWWMTRPNRFEPPSEITSACTISHDVSELFQGRRHLYGFRNQIFADAFERANASRIWTESDQSRMWTRSLFVAIVVIVTLVGARLLMWYYEGR